jgi:hypothetical protein
MITALILVFAVDAGLFFANASMETLASLAGLVLVVAFLIYLLKGDE